MPKPRDRALNRALSFVLTGLAENAAACFDLDAEDRCTWGADILVGLATAGVIRRAAAAASTVCPGCEEACLMPVEVRTTAAGLRPIIVCDKPQDHGLIDIDPCALACWRADFDSLVACLGVIVPSATEPEILAPGRFARLGEIELDGAAAELFLAHRAAPDVLDQPAIRHSVNALLLHLSRIRQVDQRMQRVVPLSH